MVLAAIGINEVQKKGPMQFVCRGKDKEYLILVDGGSVLNLISSELCRELKLTVQPQESVVMRLPNGTTFSSSAICPEVKMKYKGTDIITQAYVADLKDWHLILGVE